MRICLARNRPGPYQLQAAINAVHSDAPSVERTDWRQILALYDQLMAVAPTAVVALNRAVAVAEVHGVENALQLVDAIELPKYHLFHAVRADLLRRLGRTAAAVCAYRAALERCSNQKERDLLMRQCESLTCQ
jgi:RNA polymerase sigma-70 factor (ECF subfamily)